MTDDAERGGALHRPPSKPPPPVRRRLLCWLPPPPRAAGISRLSGLVSQTAMGLVAAKAGLGRAAGEADQDFVARLQRASHASGGLPLVLHAAAAAGGGGGSGVRRAEAERGWEEAEEGEEAWLFTNLLRLGGVPAEMVPLVKVRTDCQGAHTLTPHRTLPANLV